MGIFENIKFYALNRYVALNCNSQLIPIIFAEIKNLFKEDSLPNGILFIKWIIDFEKIEKSHESINKLELVEPTNLKIVFELKPESEEKILKAKFYAICRFQLSSDFMLIINEMSRVFNECIFNSDFNQWMVENFLKFNSVLSNQHKSQIEANLNNVQKRCDQLEIQNKMLKERIKRMENWINDESLLYYDSECISLKVYWNDIDKASLFSTDLEKISDLDDLESLTKTKN